MAPYSSSRERQLLLDLRVTYFHLCGLFFHLCGLSSRMCELPSHLSGLDSVCLMSHGCVGQKSQVIFPKSKVSLKIDRHWRDKSFYDEFSSSLLHYCLSQVTLSRITGQPLPTQINTIRPTRLNLVLESYATLPWTMGISISPSQYIKYKRSPMEY